MEVLPSGTRLLAWTSQVKRRPLKLRRHRPTAKRLSQSTFKRKSNWSGTVSVAAGFTAAAFEAALADSAAAMADFVAGGEDAGLAGEEATVALDTVDLDMGATAGSVIVGSTVMEDFTARMDALASDWGLGMDSDTV
jgi:hypothetical protein